MQGLHGGGGMLPPPLPLPLPPPLPSGLNNEFLMMFIIYIVMEEPWGGRV